MSDDSPMNFRKQLPITTNLFVHIRPIDQPLARIGMQPPPLPDAPHLRPNVIGEIETISGVESHGAAVDSEEVGVFAASTATGGKEGTGGVVAGEGRFGVA